MNTESPFAHRIARTPKRPAKLSTPATHAEEHAPESTPEPVVAAPVAPAAAPVSPMRQALIVLAAFVVTTFVMILAVLAWQVVLAK